MMKVTLNVAADRPIRRSVSVRGLATTSLLLVASIAVAQQPIPSLSDDLLDRLVGRWEMTGTVHGRPSKQTFEAAWVLNHQFLRIHEKSVENVAGTTVPFEAFLFIGYDKSSKRYVLHSMNVFGAGRAGELVYGDRTGNELTFTESQDGKHGRARFIWQPETATWHYLGGVDGTDGQWTATVDLKSTPAR
jgi:hypothetical protein